MSDVPPVLWACKSHDRTLLVLAHHPVNWSDTRAFAQRTLLTDLVTLDVVTEPAEPAYELRWEGEDYNHPPDRRMQVREKDGEWGNLR